jgi:hypothetical protein
MVEFRCLRHDLRSLVVGVKEQGPARVPVLRASQGLEAPGVRRGIVRCGLFGPNNGLPAMAEREVSSGSGNGWPPNLDHAAPMQ